MIGRTRKQGNSSRPAAKGGLGENFAFNKFLQYGFAELHGIREDVDAAKDVSVFRRGKLHSDVLGRSGGQPSVDAR